MMVEKQLLKLPSNWVWARIGDVGEITSGYGFPKKYQGKTFGEIPFYKVMDISKTVTSGSYLLTNANNYVSYEDCQGLKATPLRNGTIVFAKIGEAIKLNRRAILSKDSLVDNNIMGIYPIKNILNKLFLYYYLLTVKLGDISQATTVPSIRKSDVEEIVIPIPPPSEQHRIVAKIEELFSDLDAGVEALKKAKVQLKLYRQAVLKAAFEGRLTAAWREAHGGDLEPASVILKKVREERKNASQASHKEFPVDAPTLHSLPEKWEWVSLGELVDSMQNGIYKPREFYSSDGVACLRMYNIENGEIVWKDIKRMVLSAEEIKQYKLKVDDILINRVNSRELVGKAAVIPDNIERCVYESKNIRMRVKNNYVKSKYINYWLRLFGQGYFNMNAQQVVGMASINQPQISAMPIPFSHPSEQYQIIEDVEFRFSILDSMEKGIDKGILQAGRLHQAILKKAFTGRLVSQDPEDELAAVLLERIKKERATQFSGKKPGRKASQKELNYGQ